MSGTLKKVQSGDPLAIPAAAFNTFIDAAEAHRRASQNTRQTPKPSFRDSGIVLVENASGLDQHRFDVLGIDSPDQ